MYTDLIVQIAGDSRRFPKVKLGDRLPLSSNFDWTGGQPSERERKRGRATGLISKRFYKVRKNKAFSYYYNIQSTAEPRTSFLFVFKVF